MIASSAYHWLVQEGLYRDLLSFVIGGLLVYVVGKLKIANVLRLHEVQQEKIANLLDTEKPGGLTDVVRGQEELLEAYKRAIGPEPKTPKGGRAR